MNTIKRSDAITAPVTVATNCIYERSQFTLAKLDYVNTFPLAMKKYYHSLSASDCYRFIVLVLLVSFSFPGLSSAEAKQTSPYAKTVVTVLSYYNDEQGQVERNQGTGVFISKNLVVTVAHVVNRAEAIFICFDDGTLIQGQFYKVSPIFDIAIIQVKKNPILHDIKFKPLSSADSKTILTTVHYGGGYNQITSRISIENEMDIDPLSSIYVMNFELRKGASGGGVFFSDGSLAGLIIGLNGRDNDRAIALSSSAISIIIDDLEGFFYPELEGKKEYGCKDILMYQNDQDYIRLLSSIKANYWQGAATVLQDAVNAFYNRYPDLSLANILSAMVAMKQGKPVQGYTNLAEFAKHSPCPQLNFYLGKICAENLKNKEKALFHYKEAMLNASTPLFISLLRQRIRLLTNTDSGG